MLFQHVDGGWYNIKNNKDLHREITQFMDNRVLGKVLERVIVEIIK